MTVNSNSIKRGLLCFWALWLTVVVASNICDGLIQLQVIPLSWPFASGNFGAILKVTARYQLPRMICGLLLAGVIVWESVAMVLFWRAAIAADGSDHGRKLIYPAFACVLALMAAFVIIDEVCIVYDLEASHLRLLIALLASLLYIDRGDNA